MVINIPKNIEKCIRKLRDGGYEAYIVGGCVRDSIIGRFPNDWDICTSALPQDIKKVFHDYKTIDVGIEHGTVGVVIGQDTVEITTYRVDGEYLDNRRPESVTFTSSLKEDLSRRDFTINAMAYSNETGIVDYFQGEKDAKDKIIRCVGNPQIRFEEDGLRIMRALRFSAQLNYSIEADTMKAIYKTKELLKNISVERIAVELNKILLSKELKNTIGLLFELDIPPIIIKFMHNCSLKVDKLHNFTENCGQIIESCPQDLIIRMTMFINCLINGYDLADNASDNLQDEKSEVGEKILKSLKYDNFTIKSVSTLLKYYDEVIKVNKVWVKQMLNRIDVDLFIKLLEIKKYSVEENSVGRVLEVLDDILEKKECFKLKDLKINGKDLIDLGVKDGRVIGEILRMFLHMVIENPELNHTEKLKCISLKLINCI